MTARSGPTNPSARRLDRRDIAHLVGDLEDTTVAAILATGATYAEIEQALKWIGGGREEPRLNAEGLSPNAEMVYDILLSDPAYDEGPDRD